MRTPVISILSLLLVLGAGASSAAAGETKNGRQAPDPTDELTLPVAEVSAAVNPWTPDVRACWLRHATPRARQDGNLRLEVIIDPIGMVWRHHTLYVGARNKRLDRCLDRVMAQWRFPMRQSYTVAAVPFLFRASARPGAGPVMSCYSPRGCRKQPEK
jgi:hypothetical protein